MTRAIDEILDELDGVAAPRSEVLHASDGRVAMDDRFEVFATTIAELSRNLQRAKARKMASIGLKGPHVMCLYYLGKSGDEGMTSTELTKACNIDKAQISRSLAELIEKGYVKTAGDASLRRAYRTKLLLTPAGRDVVEKVNTMVADALEEVGGGLTSEQRSTFYQALAIINRNLADYADGLD